MNVVISQIELFNTCPVSLRFTLLLSKLRFNYGKSAECLPSISRFIGSCVTARGSLWVEGHPNVPRLLMLNRKVMTAPALPSPVLSARLGLTPSSLAKTWEGRGNRWTLAWRPSERRYQRRKVSLVSERTLGWMHFKVQTQAPSEYKLHPRVHSLLIFFFFQSAHTDFLYLDLVK